MVIEIDFNIISQLCIIVKLQLQGGITSVSIHILLQLQLHSVHISISLSQQVKALIGLEATVKTRVLALIT